VTVVVAAAVKKQAITKSNYQNDEHKRCKCQKQTFEETTQAVYACKPDYSPLPKTLRLVTWAPFDMYKTALDTERFTFIDTFSSERCDRL
jgi:hypothetical protein